MKKKWIFPLLLSSCSPTIHDIQPFDQSAGYNKTSRLSICSRLTHSVSIEPNIKDVASGGISIQKVKKNQFNVYLNGSHQMSEGEQLTVPLTYNYKIWPFRNSYRKEFEFKVLSLKNAAILSNVKEVCVQHKQSYSLNYALNPAPVFDKGVKVNAVTKGKVFSTIRKNGEIKLVGKELGKESITLQSNRPNIDVYKLQGIVAPLFAPPQNIQDRITTQAEYSTRPPDVDNENIYPRTIKWTERIGAKSYSIQIYNEEGIRVGGALLKPSHKKFVCWSSPGNYFFAIRVKLETCSGKVKWTNFSKKVPFTISKK